MFFEFLDKEQGALCDAFLDLKWVAKFWVFSFCVIYHHFKVFETLCEMN